MNKLDLKVNKWVERNWRSIYGLLSACQNVLQIIYRLWIRLTAYLRDYLDRNLKDCLKGVSYVFLLRFYWSTYGGYTDTVLFLSTANI